MGGVCVCVCGGGSVCGYVVCKCGEGGGRCVVCVGIE